MKIQELIRLLEEKEKEYGDLDVKIITSNHGAIVDLVNDDVFYVQFDDEGKKIEYLHLGY